MNGRNLGFEKEEQAQKQPENGSAHTTKEVKRNLKTSKQGEEKKKEKEKEK